MRASTGGRGRAQEGAGELLETAKIGISSARERAGVSVGKGRGVRRLRRLRCAKDFDAPNSNKHNDFNDIDGIPALVHTLAPLSSPHHTVSASPLAPQKNGVQVPDGPKGSTLQHPKPLDADWPRDRYQHQTRIPRHHRCLQGTGMMTSLGPQASSPSTRGNDTATSTMSELTPATQAGPSNIQCVIDPQLLTDTSTAPINYRLERAKANSEKK